MVEHDEVLLQLGRDAYDRRQGHDKRAVLLAGANLLCQGLHDFRGV